MDDTTLVIGHRNPDADAICSAIGYADFKNRTVGGGHEAARCGNSNERIDSILDRFGVPLPRFVGDVTPRVHDVMVRDAFTAPIDGTCSEALRLIDQRDVRALPVIDDERRIHGAVSIFQMGQFFLPQPQNVRSMRHVHTSVDKIILALGARALNLHEPGRVEDLYVRVGAMDIKSFGRFMREEGTNPQENIIVVGDRYDIQLKSIQMGMRLVVITGDLDVEPETIETARDRQVCLVVSPYDSATTSWIIRTATLLRPIVDANVIRFSADEPISNVRRSLGKSIAPIYLVADDNDRLLGVFTNSDILKPVRTRIILVDHNEVGQAVIGADQVEIVEIIDHHRLCNPPTQQPIRFINEPVGSTCTIVANLYRHAGLSPEPPLAGILMGGIISDTLHLQSPTTTEVDRQVLPWLEGIAGVRSADLADTIFSSGSVILNSQPDEVIRSDCKHYEEHGVAFSASQIEELGFDNFYQHEHDLLEALEEYRRAGDLAFSVLLVTDINSQNSLLAVTGDHGIIQQISFPHVRKDTIFDMPGIVSRKKQLIPYLTSLMETVAA